MIIFSYVILAILSICGIITIIVAIKISRNPDVYITKEKLEEIKRRYNNGL